MGSYSDVVDISSEEEEANTNSDIVGKKTHLNDSGDLLELWDDLVIMDELSAPPVLPKKTVVPAIQPILSLSDDDFNCGVSADGGGDDNDDDDDDDCQVLDHDPDKPVVAATGDKVDESDEIEIVGAKGEVACRDFPHPRHLCANFPFNTTSHDKYCKMCHCYVCDSLAPCSLWGNLADFDSHCHATDKIPMWKKLRDSNKAPSLQKTTLQNVTSRILPPWRSMPHKSYGPNLNQRSRPISIQIPSRRSTIGPITTGSMHGHRSGPYHPVRSHQLTRSNSMHGYSSNIIKQSGQPFCPVLNAHQTQPGPVLNHTQSMSNESLLRSLSAVQNSTMQRFQSQTGVSTQVATSMNLSVQRPQTQTSLQVDLADLASRSWQDIVDCVAIELGVPDYSTNTSGVQQPLGTTLPTQFGALDCTQARNMPTHAQLIDSTMEQNTENLDANGASETHNVVQDMFEAPVSPQLYALDESWMCLPEFS